MGEQFRRERAKDFKHRQLIDHKRELEQQTLLTERPEIFERHYSCAIAAEKQPEELALAHWGTEVIVLDGNRDVGRIGVPDDELLSTAITSAGGVLAVKVLDFSALTGTVTFAIKKDEE